MIFKCPIGVVKSVLVRTGTRTELMFSSISVRTKETIRNNWVFKSPHSSVGAKAYNNKSKEVLDYVQAAFCQLSNSYEDVV